MLKLENVNKTFGMNRVINDVSLEVQKGEVYGLIGANGAGKTTLMNMISGILPYDSGTITIDGKQIRNPKDMIGQVGYMLDIPSMFEFFTAFEMFEFIGSAKCRSKAEIYERGKNLLEIVGLSTVGQKQIKSYSRGMKQRIGIAAALISDPQILMMDEPTSALDPEGRFEVIEIIKNLSSQGKTILLSTHILNDVEKVCSRIGILSKGQIKIEGAISQVMARYNKPIFDISPKNSEDVEKVFNLINSLNFVERCKKGDETVRIQIPSDDECLARLFSEVAKLNVPITSFKNLQTSLEEIFLIEGRG